MNQSSHKLREQYWMSVIQQCNRECKEEGITKRQWMERHNINYQTYYRWQQRLRNEAASELLVAQTQISVPTVVESSVPQFAEVPPVYSQCSTNSSQAVLRCKNITIELNDDITDHLLLKLVKVLNYVET